MKKIEKIIKYFKENMSVGVGGFTGSADPKGPVAGFDGVIGFKRRKNGKYDYRSVGKKYKDWLKILENK
jgi:hypothetical protein